MDHEELKDKVQAYYDNEITPEERLNVLSHLKICSDCRGWTEDWGKTASLVFQITDPDPSEHFVRQVMAKIERLDPAMEMSWDWLRFVLNRWVYPTFVGAALAGFILIMTYPVQEPRVSEISPSDWFASSDLPKVDQIFNYVMGEL